jgi:hypothetical protein
MAEAPQKIDFVEVKSEDILAEHTRGWDMFTKAATWGIGAIVVVLILLKLVTG